MFLEVLKEVGAVPVTYLKMIRDVRRKRHAAQYDVSVSIVRTEAEECLEKASDFTEGMKKIYELLKETKKSLDLSI